jgi:hypothetical protein
LGGIYRIFMAKVKWWKDTICAFVLIKKLAPKAWEDTWTPISSLPDFTEFTEK